LRAAIGYLLAMSSSTLPPAADVVIIGGGFAGVATAWALARRGVHDVVLLEREPALGVHASGRGAGLGRQLAEDDETTALTVRGAQLLREHFADAWRETGGVLGFDAAADAHAYSARAVRYGVAVERVAELSRRWPALAGARVAASLYVQSDGVIDVVALLAQMADGVSARVYADAGVLAIEAGAGAGDATTVHTARGAIRARIVVEATGAWAGALLGELPPTVVKRHVAVIDARPGADASAGGDPDAATPWLWHLGAHEMYARGHADGLLASACDATSAAAGDYAVEPDAEPALRARLADVVPAIAGAPLVRQWACVRTFTGDRRMRLARDATRPWLVWAIGLGGHGATASPAVGETVAAVVVDALA
jgi:glycine/D-amino acid oxidase-like deaminating enzyme